MRTFQAGETSSRVHVGRPGGVKGLNEFAVRLGVRSYSARVEPGGVVVILLSERGEPMLSHTTRWLAERDELASLPDWLPDDVHDELVIRIARASRG